MISNIPFEVVPSQEKKNTGSNLRLRMPDLAWRPLLSLLAGFLLPEEFPEVFDD